MSELRWVERRQLRRPFLVAAFEGWNDAGSAASSAVAWLRRKWGATALASIDPEGFFDFQDRRPQIVLVEGMTRTIRWPANDILAATPGSSDRDAVLLVGSEPNVRWRSFCENVLEAVAETGCELVVTLGSLLADVPHTRPTTLTGTATDPLLVHALGLELSRYEGPTGIIGVLHDACRRAGVASVSLWASVPHYVATPPSPKATVALLERLGRLLDIPLSLGDLEGPMEEWEHRVDQLVDADPDVSAYVRRLEARLDEMSSGDSIAAQFEQFLRDRNEEP